MKKKNWKENKKNFFVFFYIVKEKDKKNTFKK
jgi:hypothetical protein